MQHLNFLLDDLIKFSGTNGIKEGPIQLFFINVLITYQTYTRISILYQAFC